jgi:hypothetical protein
MLTRKLLLDSRSNGDRVELPELMTHQRRPQAFVAEVVKSGDAFKSDSARPIFGIFTIEGDEYILGEADEIGNGINARVKLTIEPMKDSATNGD